MITQLRWFYSFWKRALALTTPEDTCVNRFINGFDVYMKSMIKEAEDRENKRVRTVDDYLQFRRETFAAQASISFLSSGLKLPEKVLLHPVMQTVTLASMDILLIINVSFKFDRTYKLTDVFIFQDMHSYPLELSRGIEFHNIITSIIHEHHLDVPAAMKWLEEFGRQKLLLSWMVSTNFHRGDLKSTAKSVNT